jgi:hypothetical protein
MLTPMEFKRQPLKANPKDGRLARYRGSKKADMPNRRINYWNSLKSRN